MMLKKSKFNQYREKWKKPTFLAENVPFQRSYFLLEFGPWKAAKYAKMTFTWKGLVGLAGRQYVVVMKPKVYAAH
jgi:hypothetical protein